MMVFLKETVIDSVFCFYTICCIDGVGNRGIICITAFHDCRYHVLKSFMRVYVTEGLTMAASCYSIKFSNP